LKKIRSRPEVAVLRTTGFGVRGLKLTKVACIDHPMSQIVLCADLVLRASQQYENTSAARSGWEEKEQVTVFTGGMYD
jgi:hypothetical protein